jgi:F-type H+-transporting ATPase subunit delta
MFTRKSWAAAFINSVINMGGEPEEGLNTLMALADNTSSWAASMKGVTLSSAQETALRFYLLLKKKKKVRHIDSVIEEIKNMLNRERGIISISAEYAFPLEREFEALIINVIKKRTGAAKVELTGSLKADLIGGYRLRIGDEIIDASIRGQLRKMEACLAGDGGN